MNKNLCTITVEGHHQTGRRGSTHRPVHDQTRPLSEFFKGMSAYGRAVSDHILACEHCTPADILQLLQEGPATMQPKRTVKRLLRGDPRTPRKEFVALLNDPQDIPWLARFCRSEDELWTGLLAVQAAGLQAQFPTRGWRVCKPYHEGDSILP